MDDVAIIPRPAVCERTDEAPFVVGPTTTVVVEPRPEMISLGVLAADLLGRMSGATIEVRYLTAQQPVAGQIRLLLDDTVAGGPEAYRLDVRTDQIVARAATSDGLMRALVTLRQLLAVGPDGAQAPAVRIEDRPAFGWRGLSLDVARHFVGVEAVKVVIGLMAHYKLNVLHLHLTDDQGWRLHVPSRPNLTRLSGGSAVGGAAGGFYSAADYASIVQYAAARGVRVVPEIDVPGHVNAATHAYGELTPSGEPTDTYTGVDVGFSRLHPDLPATTPFLQAVFSDVAAMTPGEHVHIGGDEALTISAPDYAHLVATAAAAVRAAGKKVVGWQEIANAPVEPGTVVQYWDTRVAPDRFVAAAKAGAQILMSPGDKAYLDMKYDASTPLGQDWAGHIELRDAYDWDPLTLIEGLPPESVVGVEAAVWTETLSDLPGLMSMLLPRLAAVAEVAWTEAGRRDWEDFRGRVAAQAAFWDKLGLAWYPSPQVDWQR